MVYYRRLELYLVVFFLALAGFALNKLLAESFDSFRSKEHKTNIKNGTSLARLSEANSTVKLKRDLDLAWKDALQGDALNKSDQVYTYANSNAMLSFENGTKLILAENTLFKLGKDDELLILKGTIHIDIPKDNKVHLKIRTGDGTSDVIDLHNSGQEKSEIKIAKSEDNLKNIRFSVLQGQASFNSRVVAGNEVLEIDEGKNKFLKMPILLESPLSNSHFFFNDDNKSKSELIFKWKMLSDDEFLKIQIKKGNEIIISERVDKKDSFQTDLGEGDYYWNIQTLDEKGELKVESDTYLFQVRAEKSPLFISPEENTDLIFKKGFALDFSWTSPADGARGEINSYELVLINSSTKSELFKGKVQNENFHWTPDNLNIGSEKLEFDAYVKLNENGKKSPPLHFSIHKILELSKPEIVSPENGKTITFFRSDKDQVYPLDVEWRSHERAEISGLEFDVFNKISKEHQKILKEPHQSQISFNKAGDYEIGLKLHSFADTEDRKIESEWSERLNIKVIIQDVLIDEKNLQKGTLIELKKPKDTVSFAWKQEKGLYYLFELAVDADFKEIIQSQKTKKNETMISFPQAGVFYWRTKIIGPMGSVQYSPPQKVEVMPMAPPKKPEIEKEQELEIQLDASSSGLEVFKGFRKYWDKFNNLIIAEAKAAAPFVKINWKADTNAKAYKIEIFADEEGKNKILETKVDHNFYRWENASPGIYYWKMAIIDYWDREGPPSDLAKLKLKAPQVQMLTPPLEAPLLLSPKHEYQSMENDEPIHFSWEIKSKVKNVHFMIATDLSFSKERLIYQEELNGDKQSYAIDWLPIPLPSGQNCYYWQVVIDDEKVEKGEKLASKGRQFCVSAKLEVVAAKAPQVKELYEFKKWKLAPGYSPLLSIDYLQKDAKNNSIRVTGLAWTNAKLDFSHFSPSDDKIPSLSFNTHFVKGKVFGSEPFLYLNMMAKFSLFKNSVQLLASWQQLPLYAVQLNSKVSYQKQKNLLNMGLGKSLIINCLSSPKYQCGLEFNLIFPASLGTQLSFMLAKQVSLHSSLAFHLDAYYFIFKGEKGFSSFREIQSNFQYIFYY